MRKFTVTAALTGLLALGLALPATTAQAAGNTATADTCADKWTGRDGKMYAWDTLNCQGPSMFSAVGNEDYWGTDNDKASSVMNRGYLGGRDVVAFYRNNNYGGGYTCLSPYELYADDLRDNTFTDGTVVTNAITSHQWVVASACSRWLT